MKRSVSLSFAVLAMSLLPALTGCKPDAAVERGAVVGAGPNTSETDVKPKDQPIVTEPKTDKVPPLTKVQ